MNNLNLEKYMSSHSPGYVIDTYKNGAKTEFIIGNRQILPNEEPVTSETLYDIASLTKVYTAVLVYMAYEENKLNIYDTVYEVDSKFLNLKNVKIIDLLSHNQDIWTNGYLGSVKSKEEFYEVLYSAYVKNNKPTYVDTHYIILSTLLEKIYKMNYKELCIQKITNKLNLSHTTFDPNSINVACNNFEHKNDGSIVNDIYPGLIHDPKARKAKELGITTGHASIFTTGYDLMKFLESFFENTLLTKETIEIMLKHKDRNLENLNYLSQIVSESDINTMYDKALEIDPNLKLMTYNNMGTRYRNNIKKLNDIPDLASDNSIVFSGFTGPMFTIDFDKKIIIVVMCNVMHNTKLERSERKQKTFEIMNQVFEQLTCNDN